MAGFPILAVEAMLAALASFALVGRLGLAWWLPIVSIAVVGAGAGYCLAEWAQAGPTAVHTVLYPV